MRPRISPLFGSVIQTVDLPADSVIRLLRLRLDSAGIPVTIQSAVEGYVETAWHEPAVGAPFAVPIVIGGDTTHADAVPFGCGMPIKLRFFADPVAGKTRLVAEATRILFVDPSLPERERERVVDGPCVVQRDSIVARVLRAAPPPRRPAG